MSQVGMEQSGSSMNVSEDVLTEYKAPGYDKLLLKEQQEEEMSYYRLEVTRSDVETGIPTHTLHNITHAGKDITQLKDECVEFAKSIVELDLGHVVPSICDSYQFVLKTALTDKPIIHGRMDEETKEWYCIPAGDTNNKRKPV